MPRTLVVYYSRTGHTRIAAQRIASLLGADIEEIVDRDGRGGLRGYLRSALDATLGREADIVGAVSDPAGYDLVVVGTPIWSASVSSPVRAYLGAHGGAMKRVAFFCTCGGRGASRVFRQMERICHKSAETTLFLRESEIARGTALSKIDAFTRPLRAATPSPRGDGAGKRSGNNGRAAPRSHEAQAPT